MMTTDAQILSALRSAANGGVSGAELSQKLGISRRTLHRKLREHPQLAAD